MTEKSRADSSRSRTCVSPGLRSNRLLQVPRRDRFRCGPPNTFTLISDGSGMRATSSGTISLHRHFCRIALPPGAPIRESIPPDPPPATPSRRFILRREHHGIDAAAAVFDHQRRPRLAFAVAPALDAGDHPAQSNLRSLFEAFQLRGIVRGQFADLLFIAVERMAGDIEARATLSPPAASPSASSRWPSAAKVRDAPPAKSPPNKPHLPAVAILRCAIARLDRCVERKQQLRARASQRIHRARA